MDPKTQHAYLQAAAESSRLILSNAQRIAQLVLNFKQLAVDRITEARQPFDLRDTLQGTCRALQPRLEEAGVSLQWEAAEGLRVESYPVALSQVITNLMINSIQHAFGDSDRTRRIWIRGIQEAEDVVCIEYGDNGRGMDPTLGERAFEPFVTTRRAQGGSGLGLYIVNQIITRQLGGALETHSSAAGVRFILRFPRVARLSPDMGRILAMQPRRSTK